MPVHSAQYQHILSLTMARHVSLVAVSKTKPVADIQEMYALGQRDFGENYVQEMVDKHDTLPNDIRWHFIGHLQSNKVKLIAPFVHLVQGVDSFKLLAEINKQALKCNRVIDCLLQVHIAQEETKFGFDDEEVLQIGDLSGLANVRIRGLMGMASFSDDQEKVRGEFKKLKVLFDALHFSTSPQIQGHCDILSMGMSADYRIAMEEGSTMVRIGSLLFGER